MVVLSGELRSARQQAGHKVSLHAAILGVQ
jgi:hypothetical protein